MFLDFDRFQNESDAVKIERYGQFVTYIKDKLAQNQIIPKFLANSRFLRTLQVHLNGILHSPIAHQRPH